MKRKLLIILRIFNKVIGAGLNERIFSERFLKDKHVYEYRSLQLK